jgi:hypothetical protein
MLLKDTNGGYEAHTCIVWAKCRGLKGYHWALIGRITSKFPHFFKLLTPVDAELSDVVRPFYMHMDVGKR